MANIEQLTATIQAIDGECNCWQLAVDYAMRMRYWEAGSWFAEVIEVYEGHPQQSQSVALLRRIRCNAWKLDESTPLADNVSYRVQRSVPPQELTCVDPTAIFVRVSVKPVLPEQAESGWVHVDLISETAS